MREIFETCEARYDGLIPAEALRASGMNSHAVDSLLKRGELARVRRGWYALGPHWQKIGADGRYRLFVRATAARAERDVTYSHHSAAVLHGLPLIGPWPQAVHAVDPDTAGGSSSRLLTTHRGPVDPSASVIDGVRVTSLSRTLIDMAATTSFLVGVTMVDHVLHREAARMAAARRSGIDGAPWITTATLLTELDSARPRYGHRAAERAITFANGLSANPGESLGRVRFEELGFAIPELQVRFDVDGCTYYVDYFWRGVRKIGEFDGHIKYTRAAVMDGRDIVQVVVDEKNRESLLRPQVNSFNRWEWKLALSPIAFCRFLTDTGVPRAPTRRHS
ncbi:type IV toxin-antitoxin system AbiEi family antitoxin domain-containing protein [Cryobacterium sp. Y11]|uniref:type IV toxin-antitoxin system AbiEi family antitoxin domain-containing protein n=1 Tax=Cryobacterium sp. Y11 TaxID=2045016 RepID=UPI000CE539C0|nr:type IV toxin-antitoxin system AbiEi family antitoxin domain-containing protein [Cryobacterium sp. Y11]